MIVLVFSKIDISNPETKVCTKILFLIYAWEHFHYF